MPTHLSSMALFHPEVARHELAVATQVIRTPAGQDERFATSASIQEHRDAFVREVHAAWKQLHLRTILTIASADNLERSLPPAYKSVAPIGYIRQLWRRVNDAIIWHVVGGRRHLVKRLCLYRQRGPLREANARHALEEVEKRNNDPLVLALWNDATYVVDVGDVTEIDFARSRLSFIELKEGTVNAEVARIVMAEEVGEPTAPTLLDVFLEHRGDKGAKQLERVRRQEERNTQVFELWQRDCGIDPVSRQALRVVDLGIDEESYDAQLREALLLACAEEQALLCVDECLWVYVDRRNPGGKRDILDRMAERLKGISEAAAQRLMGARRVADFSGIAFLSDWVGVHVALPLFLRDLPSDDVVEILLGNLTNRIVLFLDLEAFGRTLQGAGAEFAWSTRRQGRRGRSRPWATRSLTVNDRIPLCCVGRTRCELTGPSVTRVLFDGLTPGVLARLLVAAATAIDAGHSANG